ncbi:hypothetical protein E4U42_003935 [Claviceps africana]|uniref:N-acetyltransferase domain-containing protein n=1 Tax=Claviceps africana TaxID=83212 RepID=A0A8K0J619_9HYPO|nr:hypothetical protein E4U42_003935 [Claviceps africana]
MAEASIPNTSRAPLAAQADVDGKRMTSDGLVSIPGHQIGMADASVADDAQSVTWLARIVNDSYGEVEADIFLAGYRRTNEEEIARLIQQGWLAIACVPADENPTSDAANPTSPPSKAPRGKPIGCVVVKQLSARLGNFGMLALESKHRGRGLGRALIDFAENHCREKGCTAMQMELLVPTSFEHAVKLRMQDWYQRLGYRIIKLGSFDQDYPALATRLATPADYKVFEKALV